MMILQAIKIMALAGCSVLVLSAAAQPPNGWQLVWQDEFDYAGLPDSTKWNYDTRGNEYGWGNNEKQWYNVATLRNTEVSNGTLKIRAFKEPAGNKQYSSGRLTTKNKGDWKYCKIEVRAKMPAGRGTWPAIWMLSTHNTYGGWPASGEIDILEHVGHYPDTVFATAHTSDFNHVKRTQVGKKTYLPTATSAFHIYGLEWDEHEYRCYVDGLHYFTFKNNGNGPTAWPFDQPFHLILNLAIGGGLGGKMGIDDTLFPHTFEIDYVRVYERTDPIQRPAGESTQPMAPAASRTESQSAAATRVVQQGMVAVHTQHYARQKGWEVRNSYSGKGLQLEAMTGADNYATYPLEIADTGTYKIYLLGHRQRNTPLSENEVKIKLVHNATQQATESIVQLPANNAPVWASSNPTGTAAKLAITTTGSYTLWLQGLGPHRLYAEKIVLSKGSYVPEGTGPEETIAGTPVYTGGFDSLVVLPPHWAFGVLYGGYTNQQETQDVVQKIIDNDYPIDAYWIDSWIWDYSNMGRGPGGYLRFREDTVAYPDVKKMWDMLGAHKVKGGIWIWDCIFREGNEAVYDDFRNRKFFKNSFITNDRWHNKTGHTITGNIDFENPEAVAYWKQKLQPFFDNGLDFLKLDRSSALPFVKAAFEATQQLGKETKGRGFVLSHLHTIYDPEQKRYPTRWTGDAKITWSQPDYPDNSVYAMGGYKDNVAMTADPKRSTYGVKFLTHDAGGYDFFGERRVDEELYARWIQFASMNSVMTLFSQHTNPTKNHPYAFGPDIQASVRKYMQLRMRLFPYLYTHALGSRLEGSRMVQGDGLHEDQYLLGNSLLVAPVVEQGATERKLFFPEGTWHDWDTHTAYAGNQYHTVAAPLQKLPLFAKQGAIIPLRDYARAIELGTNQKLTLHVFTGANGAFTLLEDDGVSNAYLNNSIGKTEITWRQGLKQSQLRINAMAGSYEGVPPIRDWVIQLHNVPSNPSKVRVNGKAVKGEYNAASKSFTLWAKGNPAKTILIDCVW